MPSATYVIELDTGRNNTYGGSYDDITTYVNDLQWNLGLQAPNERIAPPARAQITLDSDGGEFRQDTLSAELITNGDFSAWSGDDPTGWTVTGESGSDPYVNEVGGGQFQGESGTGMANLYTTSSALSISQAILTIGERYKVTLDIDGVGGTDGTSPGGVVCKCGSTAVSPVYHLGGPKSFSFYATATTFVIAADAGNGTVDVTIDNVSVKQTTRYGDALRKGTLVRIRTTAPSAATLFIGAIVQTPQTAGTIGARKITIIAEDPMRYLNALEFAPSLMTDTTADVAIKEIFDTAVIPWQYAHNYWMLGIEGSSELGTTTTIYQHAATTFDTGSTTFDYTGDNLDRGNGISALGFSRDLLDAELGRLFFNSRDGTFTFHRRHRDPLNTASIATFTENDFEIDGSDYTDGDDLVNHAIVNYQPRDVGAAGTVIWSATNVPITLRKFQERTFTARYRDATNTNARVGAQDIITPFKGTDIVGNSASDGSGSSRTNGLAVSIEKGAASSKITIKNYWSTTVYLTTLQLRGTPITTFDKRLVESRDGDSGHDHTYSPATYDVPAISDDDYAQDYADYMVSKFKKPIPAFRRITFNANKTDERLAQALARTVGDHITVSESWTGHSKHYYVVGEMHTVTMGGDNNHECTLILKQGDRDQYWILGTAGYSELGSTTRAGF